MRLPKIPIDGAWTVRIDVAPNAAVPRAVSSAEVDVLAHCAMVLTWDVRA